MGGTIRFDYYYGIEAEQFSFYRVPRLLIKDERFKGLSSDAKLLYGLMLDRMALSMKNGWLDDENRAYIIYTIDAIMEDLGCSKPTCTKIMKELDSDNGIGLIEKKRRGLGKPDIIYVKNFSSMKDKQPEEKQPEEKQPEEKPDNADKNTEVKNFNFKRERNLTSGSKETELQEVKNFDLQKEENLTSGSQKSELQEVKEIAPNYTNTTRIVNANRLQVHALAYNIFNWFRRLALSSNMRKQRIDTIRLKLLKIAAKVVRSARYITFKLCSSCPYKNEFYETLSNISKLNVQLE